MKLIDGRDVEEFRLALYRFIGRTLLRTWILCLNKSEWLTWHGTRWTVKAMILVKYDFREISIIFNWPLSKVNFVAIVCIILTESPTRVIAWNVSRETCVPLIWNAGMEEEEDDFGSTPDFKLIKHEPFGRTWERIYLLFRFASIWRNR